jgi:hypothetical protein
MDAPKFELEMGPDNKPTEVVEQAMERIVCGIVKVENKKEEKTVDVEIASPVPGNPPIKTTGKKLCLPSPVQEILDAIVPCLEAEHDVAYRLGYSKGYNDKGEQMAEQQAMPPQQQQQAPLVLPVITHVPLTSKTQIFLSEIKTGTDKLISPVLLMPVVEGAMKHKREQGYRNGYWQGWKDKGVGIMPQFQSPEEIKNLEW